MAHSHLSNIMLDNLNPTFGETTQLTNHVTQDMLKIGLWVTHFSNHLFNHLLLMLPGLTQLTYVLTLMEWHNFGGPLSSLYLR
jgi:hypothetical protein